MSAADGPRVLRASDQDRHEAVLALSDHFAEGRLDRDEFDLRMTAASEATYVHDLDPLFADLPARRSAHVVDRGQELRVRGRGFPFPVVPLLLAAFIALVVLTRGHALWLIFPAIWLVAASRRRAWHHHMVGAGAWDSPSAAELHQHRPLPGPLPPLPE